MRYLSLCSALILTHLIFPVAYARDLVVNDGQLIMDAVRSAQDGDTVLVMPGTYRETVYIDKNGVSLRGIRKGGIWPVLEGDAKRNDGVIVAGHNVTIEGMHIRRYKGNGIMLQGANNFKVIRNKIEGRSFYGIFPQYAKNGLIANNILWGVEDAAIYVGMSENIDVLNNETFGSVMGIEAENSNMILFEGNHVHDNSAGIVVTLVPGLPIKRARKTIIRNNHIVNNNGENIALPGSIAASVPRGVGIMVFAADEIIVEDNIITGNDSTAFLIVDHNFIPLAKDPLMDPRPDRISILGNIVDGNGKNPHTLVEALVSTWQGDHAPDVLTTGKGRKNCFADMTAMTSFGAERWTVCDPQTSSADIASYQTSEPVEAVVYNSEQVGRLTYMAVCSGCHAYKSRLVGPPMLVIKALYKGKQDEMAQWIASPDRKRPDYPEMPPQNYLPEATRDAVAHYILEELNN